MTHPNDTLQARHALLYISIRGCNFLCKLTILTRGKMSLWLTFLNHPGGIGSGWLQRIRQEDENNSCFPLLLLPPSDFILFSLLVVVQCFFHDNGLFNWSNWILWCLQDETRMLVAAVGSVCRLSVLVDVLGRHRREAENYVDVCAMYQVNDARKYCQAGSWVDLHIYLFRKSWALS